MYKQIIWVAGRKCALINPTVKYTHIARYTHLLSWITHRTHCFGHHCWVLHTPKRTPQKYNATLRTKRSGGKIITRTTSAKKKKKVYTYSHNDSSAYVFIRKMVSNVTCVRSLAECSRHTTTDLQQFFGVGDFCHITHKTHTETR